MGLGGFQQTLPAAGEGGAVDRKRIVILLRSVVIATCAYLVLSGNQGLGFGPLLYVALFAASNVALGFAPRTLFFLPHFGPCLLLADTAVILFGMSWSHGLSQDLLLAYFFTVFLITIGETVGQIAIGSALIAAVYGYWLWVSGNAAASSDAWVRLPFFFLVAIFYASLIDQLKRERHRRQEAETENHHLRFLLDLASVFSETHATREFVRGIGRFVEGTCPGLRCHMMLEGNQTPGDTRAARPHGTAFPLRAHGQSYGQLVAETQDGRGLSERERWLCQMVTHAAAGALYAAEQSDAARVATDAKDQFLATISHEFRTPLHAILGYLDVVETGLPETADSMLPESIERMRVNACRLQHLLEELVSFAEIRSGRRAIRVESVSLQELVDELLPITRELIGGKPVTLTAQVDVVADDLRTDRRKLNRAVVCLLSNAAKFTDAGEIRIGGKRLADGHIELSISDTGIGIAPNDLSIIFDDFRQVDGSFTRRYGGLGIGLTLARELIGLLGGALEIESEVGVGTTVRVRLPQAIGEVMRLPQRAPRTAEQPISRPLAAAS
ncbi:MAG: HAMP domain-containing sensor histidine kinase [Deltaproteobacteria bacterium]|nr:HAMP domain-containing sensor histidine kinase [Deltaproteobacteria bacterium]